MGLRRAMLLLLVAATAARRLSPSPVAPASKERSGKKKVLMLISDTGGGHRASAHALEAAMLKEMDMEVKVVDVWTEYGRFPWNKMAAGYPFCCKYPAIWKAMYYTTIGLEAPTDILWRLQCGSGFKRCIGGYDPDMVVSLHPLCQNLPLKVMDTIAKEKGLPGRTAPFATVCTDLGRQPYPYPYPYPYPNPNPYPYPCPYPPCP